MISCENLEKILREAGVMPVICLQSEAETDTFLRAVARTPIRALEITLRHPYAPEAIRRIHAVRPDLTVGAGTVMNAGLFCAARDAGADFIVAPGFDSEIADLCAKEGLLYIPGCSTPTEMMAAMKRGCRLLKFFPAETMGGAATLKLLRGALSEARFLPTGGITMANLPAYLACENVVGCGGSFMAPADLIRAGKEEEIARIMCESTAIRQAARKGGNL